MWLLHRISNSSAGSHPEHWWRCSLRNITIDNYCHGAAACIIMLLQVPIRRVWSSVAKRYTDTESKLGLSHQHEYSSKCIESGEHGTRASDAKRGFLATRTRSEPDDIRYNSAHVEHELLCVVLLRRDRSVGAKRDASLRLDSEPGTIPDQLLQYLRRVALWWHVYCVRTSVQCHFQQRPYDPVASSSGFPSGSDFECSWALCSHATCAQSNTCLRW